MNFCGGDSKDEYGEKYQFDANFKGPKSGRSTTDVYWFWVFLVISTAWIIFGIRVLTTGLNYFDQIIYPDILNHCDPVFRESMLRNYNGACYYLKQTLWCYLVPILIATVICLIFCYAIRWIATPAVWLSIFVTIALFVCVSILGFMYDQFLRKTSDDDYMNDDYPIDYRNDHIEDYIGLVIGIIFMNITAVFVGFIFRQRHNVFFAIELIKEGSKAVASSYSTVFFPIIPSFFHIAFFALFASVTVNIFFVCYHDSSSTRVATHLLNCFGYLWIGWFIEGFQTMVLAHTYSTWYWTLDKTKLPFFTLTAAIRSTTRYHLGSIAVGSMILAIGQVFCKFIKTLVDNPCNLCCRINGIAQRLLRFFNNNSFIMVAIHGDPFCKSMRDAFNLLMRSDVFITSRITKLLFTIFNLFVAVGTGVLTYMLLPEHGSNQLNDDSIMYYVTIAISVYGSFIVGSRFSGVYITAVDTLFLCYMEDCERNEGTEEKPHYMSPELMRLLHKNAEIVPPPEQV